MGSESESDTSIDTAASQSKPKKRGPGRPKNKTNDSVEKFYNKLKEEFLPKLSQLEKIDPLLTEMGEIKEKLVLLLKENDHLRKVVVEQKEKIHDLEEHANRKEVEKIIIERSLRKNSFIVRGFKGNFSNEAIVAAIHNNVPGVQTENITSVERLGSADWDKRPTKIKFSTISQDKRFELLKSNMYLKNKNAGFRIDPDRSPSDAKMVAALLKFRYEMKEKYPNVTFTLSKNKLIGTNNLKWFYCFISESIKED